MLPLAARYPPDTEFAELLMVTASDAQCCSLREQSPLPSAANPSGL
mgnify:CR=1 FL=1